MTGRGENVAINTKSMKFQLCPGWLSKNLIDLARTSEYNKSDVIYLLGMAFAFPIIIKMRSAQQIRMPNMMIRQNVCWEIRLFWRIFW